MDNQRQQTDWRSIYTLSFTTFLMSLQTGTVNINLWAYITEVCLGFEAGNEKFNKTVEFFKSTVLSAFLV